jgi:hypothetical protein
MSDTVFILGAGASKQAGAPLMYDFLDVATDLLRAGKVSNRSEHFQRVFDAIGQLQRVHSKAQLDLNNIESVFNAFELGRLIQKLPGVESDKIEQVIASLKELIVTTIEVTMNFPCEKTYILPPEPYGTFAKLLRKIQSAQNPTHSVSVITFNYDVAIDIALFRESFHPYYALDKSNGRQSNSVDLLKLHGSLNWALETASKNILPMELGDYLAKYKLGWPGSEVMLPVGKQLVEYFDHCSPSVKVDLEPVIVPPSWNKSDYHKALTRVWAAAAVHLSQAENIFIIGYSLPETDSFFRLLYALGSVGESPLRRIAVFNPDETGDVDNRFRALLGPGAESRYEYRKLEFKDAIEDLHKLLFPVRRIGVYL